MIKIKEEKEENGAWIAGGLRLKTGLGLNPRLFRNDDGISGKDRPFRDRLIATSSAKISGTPPPAIPFLPFTEGLKLGPGLPGPT